MKHFAILFVLLLAGKIYAQDSTSAANRNEITLSIDPLVSIIVNDFSVRSIPIASFYKRSFKNHPRIWFNTGMVVLARIEERSSYTSYVYVSDTITLLQNTNMVTKPRLELYSGIEFRSKEKRNWSAFAGLDLYGSVSTAYRQSRYILSIHYVNNTAVYSPDVSDGPAIPYGMYRNWHAGLHPRTGLRYVFGKHWAMHAQMGLLTDFVNKYRSPSYVTNWDFDPDADLTGQFEMVYRF